MVDVGYWLDEGLDWTLGVAGDGLKLTHPCRNPDSTQHPDHTRPWKYPNWSSSPTLGWQGIFMTGQTCNCHITAQNYPVGRFYFEIFKAYTAASIHRKRHYMSSLSQNPVLDTVAATSSAKGQLAEERARRKREETEEEVEEGEVPASQIAPLSEPPADQDRLSFAPLEEAIRQKRPDTVVCLLQQFPTIVEFPKEITCAAVWAGLELYKPFFERNPAILQHRWNHFGDAVCVAVLRFDTELLTYLLENGADPGWGLDSVKTHHMFLPLEWAAMSAAEATGSLLIEYGATLKHTAALQLAAASPRRDRLQMLRLLLEAGVDVNDMVHKDDTSVDQIRVNDCAHRTALHAAAEAGCKDAVEFLLDHGAYPQKKDSSGRTAIECARGEGHDEIVALLQRNYFTVRTWENPDVECLHHD
jgi:Ankyrin repeats (3 copies)